MAAKNKSRQKLATDRQTDYLFMYFVNENKFNEQLRNTWDEEFGKKNKKS